VRRRGAAVQRLRRRLRRLDARPRSRRDGRANEPGTDCDDADPPLGHAAEACGDGVDTTTASRLSGRGAADDPFPRRRTARVGDGLPPRSTPPTTSLS
jgi:hypothetical protein